MPVKKTKPVTKSSHEEMTAPSAVGGGRTATADANSGLAAAPRHARTPGQLECYEAGIHLLHAGRYREAGEKFRAAVDGPDRGISHRARVYARMCESRLEQPAFLPQTAEEHYNYGIALINLRELATAREHLQAALAMDAGADHVHYALALCYGLAGELQNAYEHLKRAIELQPRNRITARQDADFAVFANQPPLDRLLFPEKKSQF